MNSMENSNATKAASKPPRRAKGKMKRNLAVNDDAQVAETPSDFSFAIGKIAVAQICRSVGYKISKDHALETLTNVALKYLQTLAESAASFANAANRTDSNLFDLINSLHDLYSIRGFPSGSRMHKGNLLRSGALKDLMNFVNLSSEVPFAKPIPRKNVSTSPNPEPTIDLGSSMMCCSQKAKSQNLHIPRWLPDLPKESLYKYCDGTLVKERKCGEKHWEYSLALEDCSDNNVEKRVVLQRCGINEMEKNKARMELAKERRGRLKFRIGGQEERKQVVGLLGVNMMNNGVCRGRKRVSINECMVQEKENDDERAFKVKR